MSDAGRRAAPAAKPHLPIYLHSTWRTGSTYVWSKFRARSETYCYFEPLTEHLATATPAFIDAFAPWPYANHPALDRPYLDEFRPLLAADGGVAGFPTDASFGHYRLDRTDEAPGLQDYFGRLVAFARERGRTPVFGCVRTELRLDWFRHNLDGLHIAIRRDPRCQFISCLTQAVKGNRYFLERGWVILGCNRDDPAFAPLRRLFDVPPFDGSAHEREAFYASRAWTTDWTDLYLIAFYLHCLASEAAGAADLVVDLDHLMDHPAAISDTERTIAELTGLFVSLADCRIERYEKHLAWSAPFFAEIEARVETLVRGRAGGAQGQQILTGLARI